MADERRKLPNKLYKFRDVGEYTQKVFEGQLYFAPPSSFNDPFDCSFQVLVDGADNERVIEANAWSLIRESLPDLSPEDQIQDAKDVRERLLDTRHDDFKKIVSDKLSKDTNDRVGICCLTEVSDDILMWAHYANSHQGICLEFSTANDLLRTAQPVEYGLEYPSLDLHAIVTDEDLRAAAPWMLKKADHWSYEREWRILDFETGPGVKPFPASCLTGVILGCRISSDDEAKVRQWIDSASEITLYRARQSRSSFGIEIEPGTL